MLKVKIEGIDRDCTGGVTPPLRRSFVERIVRSRFKEEGEVGIVFCDEKTIRRLNRKYRMVNQVTDVLTFPLKDRYSRGLLGEIYICLNRAALQAKEYNNTLEEEVALLITHGLKKLVNG